MQARLYRREMILMFLVLALIGASAYTIASAKHSDANTVKNRKQIEILKGQNADLTTQNGVLRTQVAKLKTALAQNETDTLKNRQTGFESRSISCEILKDFDVAAWRRNTYCQAIPTTLPTAAATP